MICWGCARDITLNTLPDFNDIQINRLPIEQGTGVPGVREILLSVNRLKAWGSKLATRSPWRSTINAATN
ncbi:MAG: hypothetical protein U0559_18690 [Anaerolineae bacterium]